jgi:hypothetical protein
MLSEKDKQENDKNMRGGGSWEAFKKRSLMISSHRKWPDMANGDTIKAIRSDILSRTSKHRRRRKKLEWHTIWWTGKSDDVTPARANGKKQETISLLLLLFFFFFSQRNCGRIFSRPRICDDARAAPQTRGFRWNDYDVTMSGGVTYVWVNSR